MRPPRVRSRSGGSERRGISPFFRRTNRGRAQWLQVPRSTIGCSHRCGKSPRNLPDAAGTPPSNGIRSAQRPRVPALPLKSRGSQRRREWLLAPRVPCRRRRSDRTLWRLFHKRATFVLPLPCRRAERPSADAREIHRPIRPAARFASRPAGSVRARRQIRRLPRAATPCRLHSRSGTASHLRRIQSSSQEHRRLSVRRTMRGQHVIRIAPLRTQAAAGEMQTHSIARDQTIPEPWSVDEGCRGGFVQRPPQRREVTSPPPRLDPRERLCYECVVNPERDLYAQTRPQSN